MRYYLTFRKDSYFILPSSGSGIVYQAILLGTKPLASVIAPSESAAFRHLYSIALLHFLSQVPSSLPAPRKASQRSAHAHAALQKLTA